MRLGQDDRRPPARRADGGSLALRRRAHLGAGRTAVPSAQQRRRIEQICAGDRWILDTAYSSWLDVPLARAQLIVGLDYPRAVSLGRLLRRTIGRVAGRRAICNGNRETLRRAFSADSIIVWHFRSFARKRARMREWAADPDGPAVLLLTSPRATQDWLRARSPGALT